jgi:hypothetical protein
MYMKKWRGYDIPLFQKVQIVSVFIAFLCVTFVLVEMEKNGKKKIFLLPQLSVT